MKKATDTTSTDKIEDYLQKLEKREKVKVRKQGLIILLIVGFLITGITTINFFYPKDTLEVYQFTDLNYDILEELVKAGSLPITVSHPVIGIDTISSIEDYIDIQILLETIANNNELKVIGDKVAIAPPIGKEGYLIENPDLPPYSLEITGKKEVGRSLLFKVKNYDPKITYKIDFGNGYQTEIKKSATYSYPMSGNFRIKLISLNGPKKGTYNKGLRIEANRTQYAQEISRANQEEIIHNKPSTKELRLSQESVETLKPINNKPLEEKKSIPEQETSNPLNMQDLQRGNTASIKPKIPVRPNIDSEYVDPKEEIDETEEDPISKVPKIVNKNKPVKPLAFAQLMPEFRGGSRAFSHYIKTNIKYPEEAKKAKIEGVVYIRFVVNIDGSLSEPYIIRSVGYGCDEEAFRLVKGMPNWLAGQHKGEKVAVYQTVPVSFNLD